MVNWDKHTLYCIRCSSVWVSLALKPKWLQGWCHNMQCGSTTTQDRQFPPLTLCCIFIWSLPACLLSLYLAFVSHCHSCNGIFFPVNCVCITHVCAMLSGGFYCTPHINVELFFVLVLGFTKHFKSNRTFASCKSWCLNNHNVQLAFICSPIAFFKLLTALIYFLILTNVSCLCSWQ